MTTANPQVNKRRTTVTFYPKEKERASDTPRQDQAINPKFFKHLKYIKMPSKEINEWDIKDMKRMSKVVIPRMPRVPKFFIAGHNDSIQKRKEDDKIKKNRANFERMRLGDLLDKQTVDFLEFARDQGAFDWQSGNLPNTFSLPRSDHRQSQRDHTHARKPARDCD